MTISDNIDTTIFADKGSKIDNASPHGSCRCRAIWISDIHFRTPGYKAEFSLDFLKNHESEFRQELALVLIFFSIVTFYINFTLTQKVILFSSITLVSVVELLNSDLEAAIDKISFENCDLSKRAKELGSVAVFVFLLSCVLCWVIVMFDYVSS